MACFISWNCLCDKSVLGSRGALWLWDPLTDVVHSLVAMPRRLQQSKDVVAGVNFVVGVDDMDEGTQSSEVIEG